MINSSQAALAGDPGMHKNPYSEKRFRKIPRITAFVQDFMPSLSFQIINSSPAALTCDSGSRTEFGIFHTKVTSSRGKEFVRIIHLSHMHSWWEEEKTKCLGLSSLVRWFVLSTCAV